MSHLAGSLLLVIEAGASASFYFVAKLPHGLLRNSASFAACQRSLRYVYSSQNFRAGALALFPQRHRFLHRIFFALKTAGLDGLVDKCLLVGRKIHFHDFRVKGGNAGVKRARAQ